MTGVRFLISADTNVTSPNIIKDNESEKLIRNVVYLKISSFEDQKGLFCLEHDSKL